jgi:hypothetical protein
MVQIRTAYFQEEGLFSLHKKIIFTSLELSRSWLNGRNYSTSFDVLIKKYLLSLYLVSMRRQHKFWSQQGGCAPSGTLMILYATDGYGRDWARRKWFLAISSDENLVTKVQNLDRSVTWEHHTN